MMDSHRDFHPERWELLWREDARLQAAREAGSPSEERTSADGSTVIKDWDAAFAAFIAPGDDEVAESTEKPVAVVMVVEKRGRKNQRKPKDAAAAATTVQVGSPLGP